MPHAKPTEVCICPHYGFVLEGSIQAVYPNTDWPEEEATAGEVYFFPLTQCMDAMQRVAEQMSLSA